MMPEDDPTIGDETALYRRINPAAHLTWDDNRGCRRVSSGAFRDPEMSVALGDTLEALGREPDTVLRNYTGQFLVAFRAAVARDQGQRLVRDPTIEEEAHGLVLGKKRGRVMRVLSAASRWVVRPGDACARPNGEEPQDAPISDT
jgi:hypothetical protein